MSRDTLVHNSFAIPHNQPLSSTTFTWWRHTCSPPSSSASMTTTSLSKLSPLLWLDPSNWASLKYFKHCRTSFKIPAGRSRRMHSGHLQILVWRMMNWSLSCCGLWGLRSYQRWGLRHATPLPACSWSKRGLWRHSRTCSMLMMSHWCWGKGKDQGPCYIHVSIVMILHSFNFSLVPPPPLSLLLPPSSLFLDSPISERCLWLSSSLAAAWKVRMTCWRRSALKWNGVVPRNP